MEKNYLIHRLIANYVKSRDDLNEAGVLRTVRNLQREYAEWLFAKKSNLTLAESMIKKRFDAIDAQGKTHQVKSSMVCAKEQINSFEFHSIAHKFKYLIGVFFNKELEVNKVSYEEVIEHTIKNKTSYRFRWRKGVADSTYTQEIN